MTKEERHDLAALGLAAKVRMIEVILADAYKEFPEIFLRRPRALLASKRAALFPSVEVLRDTSGAVRTYVRKKAGRLHGAAKIRAQRARTAKVLELIAQGPTKKEALRAAGMNLRGLGMLVRRGYLKHTARGYVRTSKVFAP